MTDKAALSSSLQHQSCLTRSRTQPLCVSVSSCENGDSNTQPVLARRAPLLEGPGACLNAMRLPS